MGIHWIAWVTEVLHISSSDFNGVYTTKAYQTLFIDLAQPETFLSNLEYLEHLSINHQDGIV